MLLIKNFKNMWEKIETKIFHILYKMKIKETSIDSIIQFIKFGIVGLSNTFISYSLNAFILLIMTPLAISWDFIIGNVVSFVVSVLWSFYWNNKIVFCQGNKKRVIWKALLKTYAAYGFTGIFLSNLLSWVWIEVFHISKYIAPLFNLVISVPVNFIINKLWAFKAE